MLKGLFILDPGPYDQIYGDIERAEINSLVDIYAPPQTIQSVQQNPAVLHDADVIISGWGAPEMDEQFLAAAPNLKVVFYGSGSVRGIVTDDFWRRGVRITSAYAANAVPVVEYTLSQILFCLKRGWQFAMQLQRERRYPAREDMHVPGAYGTVVGLVSLGMVGRLVAERLKPFDLKVIAYDPFVSRESARNLDVEPVSLDEVFRRSEVVSLHTPWLKETEGLITGRHFELLRHGATFINTARGAVVNEPEMIAVLQRRPDLFAVLDVTHPEPPGPDSPLYTLPNVVLTPHIAGSMDGECRRMGRYMVDELHRYLAGEPLVWSITQERAEVMA
jgi:phosphoglycerate dehydrogenase-like enzyme